MNTKNTLSLPVNAVRAPAPVAEPVVELTHDQKIAAHKAMYKDSAISAPYAHKPLTVKPNARLSKSLDSMECICSYTGIVISIEVPRIEGHVFEYQNPLSIYANVKGMIAQGVGYLNKLDSQLLAGMYLTAYRHYDLLEAYSPKSKHSGAAMNAMLRTAGKDALIEALDLINLINSRNAHKLPSISFDYSAHMHSKDMGPAIKEYTKLIRGILFPEAIAKTDKALLATVTEENMRITERNDNGTNAAAKIVDRRGSGTIKTFSGNDRRDSKLNEKEQEFEELFKKNKKQAKALIAKLEEDATFAPKFIQALRTYTTNRNLVLMDNSTRQKFITKLETKPCNEVTELVRIFRDSQNDLDIFGEVLPVADVAKAETAIASTLSAPVKLSVAEKIALMKERAKANSSSTASTQPNNGSEF